MYRNLRRHLLAINTRCLQNTQLRCKSEKRRANMEMLNPSDPSSPFNFPLNQCYVAFGDESITPQGTFYGLVLLPEDHVLEVERKIGDLKKSYGGSIDTPIHCSQFFSPAGRARTKWAGLSNAQAVELCAEIFQVVASYSPKYVISHIPARGYPKRVRLVGKNGHADLIQQVDERWLTLQAFMSAAAFLDPADILMPTDPLVTPPLLNKNKPSWRIHVRRVERGMRVRKIILDREQATIRWFSKAPKWSMIARDIVIEGPMGASHLPIEITKEKKHSLLEIADLFVYAAVSKVRGDKPLRFDFSPRDLISKDQLFPEEVVLGGPQEEQPSNASGIQVVLAGKCVRFSVSSNRDESLLRLTMEMEDGKAAVVDFNGEFITKFQTTLNHAIQVVPGLASWRE